MPRQEVQIRPGDSLVVGQYLNGITLVREGRTVGEDLRYTNKKKPDLVLKELSQREKKETYSKYIALATRAMGTIDPFSDHQKDLSKRGKKNLVEALRQTTEALEYGHEESTSPLKEKNLRLNIYYRKALLEYNLNPKDVSIAIGTIDRALDEIADFSFDQATAKQEEHDIFNNYKNNLQKQRELMLVGIDADQVIKLAQERIVSGDKEQAVMMLEEALFNRQDISNRELSILALMKLVTKLVQVSIGSKDFVEAQSYIDYARETFDSKLFQESDDAQLVLVTQELRDNDNDPAFKLELINSLKQAGKLERAQDFAIAQAPMFTRLIASNNSAVNLWLEKAEAEYRRFLPDELVLSLKTLVDERGFHDPGLVEERSLEDQVKQLYFHYSRGSYQKVLDASRELLKTRENEPVLREHLYWLQVRGLMSQGLRAGTALKQKIMMEYPDSKALHRLIIA